jgi:hypothetical protein
MEVVTKINSTTSDDAEIGMSYVGYLVETPTVGRPVAILMPYRMHLTESVISVDADGYFMTKSGTYQYGSFR